MILKSSNFRSGSQKILCIIPARGGSKGIPLKNIYLLNGKPLLSYSIEQAQACPAISRVVVSTDHPQIMEVAREWGAEIIVRPAELSGDTATSESALSHALDYLKEQEAYEPDVVVFLQATSPIRRPYDLLQALQTFQHQEADSLFSACKLHGFVWKHEEGGLESVTYDYRRRPRRQEAPEFFQENGSIYIFKPWVLRSFNNRLGGKIAVYLMNILDSFQIDEPRDVELMEQLLALRVADAVQVDLTKIRLLVLDFDGVLTDNRVLVNQGGQEAVWCNRADGWGIARAKEAGLEVVVLSTEGNVVVSARCQKLNIPCVQDCSDKQAALKELAASRGLRPEEVAFVGNDVNDLDALNWVGAPIAVADAHPRVRAVSRLVTTKMGGQGAAREVIEWIVTAKNSDE